MGEKPNFYDCFKISTEIIAAFNGTHDGLKEFKTWLETVDEFDRQKIDALIIGGGIGGLLAAVRIQKIGLHNIRIIDKAGDFGGTWYWNRYPGAQCDTEAYIYMPLLEETGYVPTERYAYQPEIFQY